MRSGTPWAASPIFAIVQTSLFLGALVWAGGGCTEVEWAEKSITVVVPSESIVPTKAPPRAKPTPSQKPQPTPKTEKPSVPTEQQLLMRWLEIKSTLRERRLNQRDLQAISPAALGLPEDIGKANPLGINQRLTVVYDGVLSLKMSRDFLLGKVRRTKDLLVHPSLSATKTFELSQRLSSVEKLLKKRKYEMANVVLNEIQNEVDQEVAAQPE